MTSPATFDLKHPPDFQVFKFGHDSDLARDEMGRRVLVDADGVGSIEILRSPDDFRLMLDQEAAGEPPYHFLQDVTGAACQSGEFEAILRIGSLVGRPNAGELRTASAAPGWVKWSGEGIVVDERVWTLRLDHLSGPIWIPVWEGFRSAEPMEFVPSGLVSLAKTTLAPHGLPKVNEWKWEVQNASESVSLECEFSSGQPQRALVRSHLNAAHWTVDLPKGTRVLRLEKTFDAFHGRQRARVLIDGQFVGWWHVPYQNRVSRWAVSSFLIGENWLAGKEQLNITLDPPAGVPLWSVGELTHHFFGLDSQK